VQSSDGYEHWIFKAAHEQIAKEIEELTQAVAAKVPRKAIFVRVVSGGDDELPDEFRECFEQGRSSGRFPLLSGYLSDLPDEEKEEFFKAGWLRMFVPPALAEEPWNRPPYNGNEDWYKEALYNGEAAEPTDLRSFAQEWLEELARVGYGHGFILTGRALADSVLGDNVWHELRREPYLLETSLPGVLAAGDVRSGSIKRVASAVGEGSMAVRLVHQYLSDTGV
jgi:hypothetical protein